jgi:ankyrin repeat protein
MKFSTACVSLHTWKNAGSTCDEKDLLMRASQGGDLHTAKRMLLAKADVNECDKDGITPLHVASSPAMVDLLIAYHAILEERAGGGWTCLMTASRDGKTSVVGALLAHGARVNAVNTQSWTSLMLATRNNDLETMKLLLEHKADDSKTPDTYAVTSTSLQVANRFGSMTARALLLDNDAKMGRVYGTDFTELMIAAEKGDSATVTALLDANEPVNKSIENETALTLATRNGHHETVIALLNHGATAENRVSCGKTVLMLAVDSGSLKTVDAIMLHGYARAKDIMYIAGETPYTVFDWALCNNATAVALLLLAYDTDSAEALSYDVYDNSQRQLLKKKGVELNNEISEWKRTEQQRQVAREFHAARTGDVISWRIRRAMQATRVWDDGWMFFYNGLAMHGPYNGPYQTLDEFVPCYRVSLLDRLCVLHPAVFMSQQKNPPVLTDVGVDRPYMLPSTGTPPLIRAAQDGNIDQATRLLDNMESQATMCNIHNATGLTALHVASIPQMAQLLINRRFPVDIQTQVERRVSRDDWDITPLMTAARAGRSAVVATLLKNNADLTLSTMTKLSALSFALKNNRLKVADLLFEHARSHKDPRTAEWVEKNVLSGENDGCETCLMYAVYGGSTKAVRWVLDKGAAIDASTYWDETALTIACSIGDTAIVALLLKRGARELGATRYVMTTALQEAAQRGFVAVVSMLLEHDFGIHRRTHQEHTALMEAAFAGETEVVRLLLAEGAGEGVVVEWTDYRHRWVNIIETSVQTPSDKNNVILALNLLNRDNKTALMLAAQKGYHAIVSMLITYNADVDLANIGVQHEFGTTALSYAVLGGHLQTVNTLILEGHASIEKAVDLRHGPLVPSALKLNTAATLATATLLIAYGADVGHEMTHGATQQHAVVKGILLRDKVGPWYQKKRQAILWSRLPPNAPRVLLNLTMEYETVDMLAAWRAWESEGEGEGLL